MHHRSLQMKLTFSVYDSKAKLYSHTTMAINITVALRAFQYAANTEGHEFNTYPGDFTLFQTGTFNEETGKTTDLETHRNLGLALHFVQAAPIAVPTVETTPTLNIKEA